MHAGAPRCAKRAKNHTPLTFVAKPKRYTGHVRGYTITNTYVIKCMH